MYCPEPKVDECAIPLIHKTSKENLVVFLSTLMNTIINEFAESLDTFLLIN